SGRKRTQCRLLRERAARAVGSGTTTPAPQAQLALSSRERGARRDREFRQADRGAGAAAAPSRPTRTSRTMELGRLGANDHAAAGASYRVCFDNTPIATELTLPVHHSLHANARGRRAARSC